MDADDPIVAEATRDGFLESTHRGRVVALDSAGKVALAVGRVDLPVLLRSCAKPLQVVGMVRSGLDLDAPHLAIAAASHDGTAMHTQLVREVLAIAGLDESVLDNTPALPLNRHAAAQQLVTDGPDRLGQNCSGKHAAMLATCVVNGWPLDSYLDRAHPLQHALIAATEDLAGEMVAHVATDGCGAPIGAVSLIGLARAFARLATADSTTPEGRVTAAIRAHPVTIGGEDRDVSRFLRAVPGSVAKDGAEGCYAAALDDGRAVALKIADGAQRARVPVLVAALRSLGATADGLDRLAELPILGHGRPVGAVRARLERRRP